MTKYTLRFFNGLQQEIATETDDFSSAAAAKQRAAERCAELQKSFRYDVLYQIERGDDTNSKRMKLRLNNTRRGVKRQSKLFSFRVDDDILELFQSVVNKGRMINTLLRNALTRREETNERLRRLSDAEEYPPKDLTDRHYYEP